MLRSYFRLENAGTVMRLQSSFLQDGTFSTDNSHERPTMHHKRSSPSILQAKTQGYAYFSVSHPALLPYAAKVVSVLRTCQACTKGCSIGSLRTSLSPHRKFCSKKANHPPVSSTLVVTSTSLTIMPSSSSPQERETLIRLGYKEETQASYVASQGCDTICKTLA